MNITRTIAREKDKEYRYDVLLNSVAKGLKESK
jgi:hypothetical protein